MFRVRKCTRYLCYIEGGRDKRGVSHLSEATRCPSWERHFWFHTNACPLAFQTDPECEPPLKRFARLFCGHFPAPCMARLRGLPFLLGEVKELEVKSFPFTFFRMQTRSESISFRIQVHSSQSAGNEAVKSLFTRKLWRRM